MKFKTVIQFFLITLLIYDVGATDLKTPMDLYSAQVLPKGVRNIRFRGLLIQGNDRFDNSGSTVALGDPFYRDVSWNDLVDNKSDAENKNLLKGYLEAKNVNLNDIVGKTTGDVSVEARPFVPIFAIGINERLTTAVAVPIIRYQVNVATGYLYNSNLQDIYQELKNDRKFSEFNELSKKMLNPVATKLKDFGYNPLESKEGSQLGDINLLGKYLALNRGEFKLTTQGAVTLPTGEGKNEDSVVSIGSDKVWAVSGVVIADYEPIRWLGITTSLGYTHKMPDSTEKRIPYREDSKLTPDKEKVRRQLGDETFGQMGVRYIPYPGITFSSGYTFQYKSRDKYQGNAFDNARYGYMGANTIQRLETLTLGLKLDTISLFRQGKFKAPLEVAFNHSRPLSGKNVTKDPQTTLDLSMFF